MNETASQVNASGQPCGQYVVGSEGSSKQLVAHVGQPLEKPDLFRFRAAPITECALCAEFLSEKTRRSIVPCRWADASSQGSAESPEVYVCEAFGGASGVELAALIEAIEKAGKFVILLWTDDWVFPSPPGSRSLVFDVSAKPPLSCTYGWNTQIYGPECLAAAKPFDERRILASFVGSRRTHSSRDVLFDPAIINRPDVVIEDVDWWGTRQSDSEAARAEREARFRDVLLDSKFAFCPRGNGPSSKRRWEAAYCGAIPILIDDLTIPFGINLPLLEFRTDSAKSSRDSAIDLLALTVKALPEGNRLHARLRDSLTANFDTPALSGAHTMVGQIIRIANSAWVPSQGFLANASVGPASNRSTSPSAAERTAGLAGAENGTCDSASAIVTCGECVAPDKSASQRSAEPGSPITASGAAAYLQEMWERPSANFTLLSLCASSASAVAALSYWKDQWPLCQIVVAYEGQAAARLKKPTSCIQAGSLDDESFLWHLVQTCCPSVVIDQDLRAHEAQLHRFKVIYPMLKTGAIYIIEGLRAEEPVTPASVGESARDQNTVAFLANVAAAVTEDDNHHGRRWGFASAITLAAGLTASIEFRAGLVALEKRGQPHSQHSITPARLAGEQSWVLANGGRYERRRPRIINANPSVLAAVGQRLDSGVVAPPEARVTSFSDAIAMMHGVIVTNDGRVVDESLYGIKQLERVGGRYCRPRLDSRFCYISWEESKPNRLEGPVVLLKQWNDSNYGHWLFENFSRIDLVRELFELSALRFMITNASDPMRRVYLSALEALGIEEQHIVEADHRPIQIDRLIFPSPLTEHPWVIAPRVIEFLEEVGRSIDPTPQGPKRIYVSRNRIGRRSLVNEAEIVKRLEPFGFVLLNCEQLTFRDQVKAFGNAELVIGTQGAALTNLAFSPRGVCLLALTNEFMADSWFWDLVDHKAGRYVSIHGRATNPELGMQSDFLVDTDEVLRTVRELGLVD